MHLGVDSLHWSLVARPLDGVKVGGWHLVPWHHHFLDSDGKRERCEAEVFSMRWHATEAISKFDLLLGGGNKTATRENWERSSPEMNAAPGCTVYF